MKIQTDKKTIYRVSDWIKLDNAAKLFPAIISEELSSVFRITASLKNPVMYHALKESVRVTSGRFPYFSVSLRKGFFWHFLEYNDLEPGIMPEGPVPCTPFPVMDKEPLYRILARRNRISVEFIHILTDGAGALEYLKSLLYTYLQLTGNEINSSEGIIIPGSEILKEETEDSYNRFYRKLPEPQKLGKAWHLPFRVNKKPCLRIIRAEIDGYSITDLAKNANVSVTEYFVAVYLFALQTIYLEEKNKSGKKGTALRCEVPVNLRRKYSSRTMRNFSLFVMTDIDLRLGVYSFEEILRLVHHQMQTGTEEKQIARFLSKNVSYEKNFFVRILPRFLKELAISIIYREMGSKQCSGIVTNLGRINLPGAMQDMIESFDVVPTPPNNNVKVNCALVTFGSKLRVCFSNKTSSHKLERIILSHFILKGIKVRLIDNN